MVGVVILVGNPVNILISIAIARNMPSVSLIGEVVRARNFKERNLFCKYELVHDEIGKEYWSVVEGEASGQTQLDVSAVRGEVTWAHPMDIVYSCSSLRGWPKMRVEVWHQDEYQRAEIGSLK